MNKSDIIKAAGFHACETGDCEHLLQSECDRTLLLYYKAAAAELLKQVDIPCVKCEQLSKRFEKIHDICHEGLIMQTEEELADYYENMRGGNDR